MDETEELSQLPSNIGTNGTTELEPESGSSGSTPKAPYESVLERIDLRTARVAVIGMGYVGLPLAAASADAGFSVTGFDVDPAKVRALNGGSSYIDAVPTEKLRTLIQAHQLAATSDFEHLKECDIVLICVPTPLSKQREPDLSYILKTTEQIALHLRPGQLVILESTTFPGTTVEVMKPILEQTGLTSGAEFWIGYSPEREDPGSRSFSTATIPKVVAGEGAEAQALVTRFYGACMEKVVPVSSPGTAEAVKITENVFRAVNIALVNELKIIYDKLGIDVWEVIDAAATKPFGFMPFYPGPGLGGHCIPIDPFYLSWRAREHGVATRFIELAGEINISMPQYVVSNLEKALDIYRKKSLSTSKILLLGVSYKKNVSDVRESPAFALLELLEERGVYPDYHDPLVAEIPPTREHSSFAGRKSVDISPDSLISYDAVLVVTDHDDIDYETVVAHAPLVVDTRNVCAKRGLTSSSIVKT